MKVNSCECLIVFFKAGHVRSPFRARSQVSLTAFLTLFSARTQNDFIW